MPAMKWWGWGHEGVEFSHEDKPALGPFIADKIGVDVWAKSTAPLRFDELEVAEPNLPAELRADLEEAVGERFVSTDAPDRVVHGRGKSLRDLIRQRRGELPRLPDVVVRPGSEEEVTATVQAAMRADAVLIPFGGGSSISGSLQAPDDELRPVISVDLEHLEEQLAALGFTFGHFPDSF